MGHFLPLLIRSCHTPIKKSRAANLEHGDTSGAQDVTTATTPLGDLREIQRFCRQVLGAVALGARDALVHWLSGLAAGARVPRAHPLYNKA